MVMRRECPSACERVWGKQWRGQHRRCAAGCGGQSGAGAELRRAREVLGWSRIQLVERLPSGIGDRTLLSYEHGTRHLTVLRFVEISRELITDAPTLLSRGLQ